MFLNAETVSAIITLNDNGFWRPDYEPDAVELALKG